MGCIHFDAHADTLDTLLGTKINHGTPFRRAVEEELIDPRRMIQIGLRGTRYSDEDIAFGYDVGMRLITMDDFEALGRAQVITEARRVVGGGGDLYYVRHRRARSHLRHRHGGAGTGRVEHAGCASDAAGVAGVAAHWGRCL